MYVGFNGQRTQSCGEARCTTTKNDCISRWPLVPRLSTMCYMMRSDLAWTSAGCPINAPCFDPGDSVVRLITHVHTIGLNHTIVILPECPFSCRDSH